ncbi:nucleotidyltransferase family protein [Halalkaliarchaeum sp. AArc-CO]|uniref:nucleotidyltransferase family protein n=1 Tax=Halalkaliarchaeum sp. AArc-CO TaxID=2866381 RepID=UPI00217D7296|nr:nucleotidyltransferase family protein [Halalkaliarchaeum sp. AArc-CO]
MPPDEEIRAALAALKPELQEEYPISELGIFGSYARGEQRPDSDLDVLVAFERPVTLLDLVRLENELTERLGVDVDLVTKGSLKPRIESRVTDDVVYVSPTHD